MQLTLRLSTMMECSCCKQFIISENQDKTTINKKLFGAAQYAVCPLCGQTVNKEDQTKGYKNRWTRIKNKE